MTTSQRIVRKSLAGEEDILFGEDTQTQTRNGVDYTITKVRNIRPVNSLVELNALDTTRFQKAALFDATADTVAFYSYNAGSGLWELADARNDYMVFDTMADAIASTKVYEGAVLLIKDRANSHWDVVLSSGVTENTYDIVQCTGVGALSFVLRLDGGNTSFRALGAVGDGATDADDLLSRANTLLSDGATLYGHPDDDYLFSGIQTITKEIYIDLKGGTISSAALSNSGIKFTSNGSIFNATCDNMYIAWEGTGVTFGMAYNCYFINQTYSNTTAYDGASGVIIDYCRFTGMAEGPAGTSNYPCFQGTTGADRCKFTRNWCYDVEAGVTWSGGNSSVDSIIVRDNHFESMTYYALKTLDGNYFTFCDNYVKDCLQGVFYDGNDSPADDPLTGNQLVCNGNTFINVQQCVRNVASTNSYIRMVFRDNYCQGCDYGVLRSTGHNIIEGNHFYNGGALYYYGGGSLSSWDLSIENNVIRAGVDMTGFGHGNDTDGTPILGSIIIGALTDAQYKTAVTVRNNYIHDYHTNGITISSLGSQYPRVTITDNKFDAGANSTYHMSLGASRDLILKHNKEITAPSSGVEVFFPRIDRHVGFPQYRDNDWQFAAAAPTTKTWLLGSIQTHSVPASAGNIGWVNVFSFSTTLTATEPITETSMAVTSGTGTANGDIIGVMMDSGAIHWTTIASGGGTTTLVLTSGLAGEATSGKRVYVFRWKSYGTIA